MTLTLSGPPYRRTATILFPPLLSSLASGRGSSATTAFAAAAVALTQRAALLRLRLRTFASRVFSIIRANIAYPIVILSDWGPRYFIAYPVTLNGPPVDVDGKTH